jgi:hypothetical protein
LLIGHAFSAASRTTQAPIPVAFMASYYRIVSLEDEANADAVKFEVVSECVA